MNNKIQKQFTIWSKEVYKQFPELQRSAEIALSVMCQLKINDIRNPFALVFVDVPSSGKTITLNMFSTLKDLVYTTDNFTPASFVSHAANVPKKKLTEVDLLPKIKGKVLIVRDLATIFGEREEDLLKNLGVLTRVLDGEGLELDSGLHGKRGYKGDYSFMLLAGSTPIPPRVWKMSGNLGSRLFFSQIRSSEKEEDELAGQLIKSTWLQKQEACQKVTEDFMLLLLAEYPTGIDWDKSKDPIDLLKIISRCAKLLARLRAPINVWEEKWTKDDKESYLYTEPIIEKPDRINQLLYNLARGHALAQGREQIAEDDLSIVIDVTFDSAPRIRTNLFRLLIDNAGELLTNQVMATLSCSHTTAHKEMQALKILGLVEIDEGHGMTGQEKCMNLKDSFKWFLSDECKGLRITGTKTLAAATKFDSMKVKSIPHKDLPPRLQKYTSDKLIEDFEEAESKGEI
ncbi:hypothetical protein A3A70_03055 [candidate division WWE3 bacterium RIFCSPLOWO2_01_FULL_42_11]|uniref:DUF3631 domain-containing protein n=2 Tax=Bacteria candidate phyla TaxID=1783234 RepID=A0A1F4VST5_UNCKA|nr:MAG: hypothetical protein A3A70_03055 [candidate division WWE3 bacterium RIFCSPLOWO2_01_FULL_42_11]OGG15305.1 MAG: hypothetical protein A2773_03150 [Candidatus Gottesmanbacteria bacterium RIFCSPHIGHO2_01_FULL_39_10]